MSGATNAVYSAIWVCFERPAGDPPPHVIVLSFMAPSVEAAVEAPWGAQMVSGRILIDTLRSHAREEYVRLVARLGSTACAGGRTLRQALDGPGGYSRWWFLDLTEKDCLSDEDAIYTTLLQATAVQSLKAQYGIERVTLYGAPPAFAAAVGERAIAWGGLAASLAHAVIYGLLSRLALAVEYLGLWWTLRTRPSSPSGHWDVLLQSYWDWSIRPDSGGTLRDAYFTDLPAALASRGLSVGWLASCEPRVESWQRGRSRSGVVSASRAHAAVTLVERYLNPLDVLRTAFNLRYPVQTTRFLIDRRFRHLCRTGGCDLYPIIWKQVLRAAWAQTSCRLQLLATAIGRACRDLRPSMVLTCFEFFLKSRAFYAGARAFSSRIPVWAAQHAGYSSDKTLGVFDAEREVRGVPDGCAMPAPDGIFALGSLSERVWRANGFTREQVVATGGLRFQAVRIESRRAPAPAAVDAPSILLVGGMSEAAQLDLCDAAATAAAGLPVRIAWRDHPKYLFSQRAAFRRFQGVFSVTSGSVDEDLAAADLVLFTQTGLAEEALLRGIPTWQWLWPGFNTSVFVDLPIIPTFTSATALRRELEAFLQNPAPYLASPEMQQRVLLECFGADPAQASGRIADAVCQMVGVRSGGHA